MSREVRRVPLDFNWPLRKVWHGYINPHYRECPAAKDNLCDNGRNLGAQWLNAISRLIAMIGEHSAQEPYQDELRARGWTWPHPYLQGWQQAPHTQWPREVTERLRAIDDPDVKRREMYRYHLDNPPRLLSFGPEIGALIKGLAKGRELDTLGSGVAWEISKTLLTAAGMDPETFGTCTVCNGSGMDPAAKKAYEAWRETPVPEGDGWQMWSTTSEGQPISPVFATAEECARWCADNGVSAFGVWTADYDWWLKVCHGTAGFGLAVSGGTGETTLI